MFKKNLNLIYNSTIPKCRTLSSNSSKIILRYNYVPNMLEKRVPFRSEHLQLAERYLKEGKLIAGGAFVDSSGAQFIFHNQKDHAEEFMNNVFYTIKKMY